MSNTQVGNVYQQIISDVIDSSRVDFEEGGVDESVLEHLRMGWQQKLSQLGVATFPWDPKPEPTPAISNPPTVPSNAGNYQAMGTPPISQNQGGGLTMPQMSSNNVNASAPRIKTEPGLGSPHLNNNGGQPYQSQAPLLPPTATTAEQRAAQNLNRSYGVRAAASINAIQSGRPQQGPNGQQQSSMQQMQMPQMQQMPMNQEQYKAYMQQIQQNGARPMQQQQQQQQGQGQQQQRPQLSADQYKLLMAQQAARGMQQASAANGGHGVGNAQTDGAGDEFEGLTVIKQFGPNGEEMSMGRVEIDGLIRSRIEAMGQRMEGGGLMLPLQQASSTKSRKRKVKSSKAAGKMAQVDGVGDDDNDKDGIKDEELDEDAINSDLDDPDENANDDEEDDELMGNIMLCMYDKVQRVKNKWKCVMKDGVLTVNGREYVFHKASGEYEW